MVVFGRRDCYSSMVVVFVLVVLDMEVIVDSIDRCDGVKVRVDFLRIIGS